MEVSAVVFDWLKGMQVVQEGHIQKRKKTGVVLTPDATRAMLSGHVAYYAACNGLAQRGQSVSQSLVGNPGDIVAAEGCHYNWSVVCELLAKLGVGLSPDHRMLLGNGDPGIIADLLKTMSTKLPSAEAVKSKKAARSPSPGRRAPDPTDRTGAVSVDQGKKRIKSDIDRFDAFKDLERIRSKREEKLLKQQAAEQKAKEVEQRMKEMRDKLSAVNDIKKGMLQDMDVTSPPLSCYLDFKNRGNVQFCHQIILGLLQDVVSGAAQLALKQREAERKKAKELAQRRKIEGDRMVPLGAVTVARELDHRPLVMCKEIVYDMITRATLPQTKEEILRREREREEAAKNAQRIRNRIDTLYEKRTIRKKFDDIRKEEEQRLDQERETRDKRYATVRKLVAEIAVTEAEEHRRQREDKELARRLKEEDDKRKSAEKVLYYAEQKAKVLEARRMKAIEDELRRVQQIEEEREQREQKRLKMIEISKKLMEKELQRDASSNANGVPSSLNPVSIGTGQRSGYTGNTLGWQFLTDDERHVAELVHSVRSDPSQCIGIVESRVANTKGNIVWFTDQSGRRHPLTLAEGPEVHGQSLDSLKRMTRKPAPVVINMSIALTLAARCHAADLAHHGIADPGLWHIGTDGSSATLRVARFGTGLGGPGTTQEIVVSVVHPVDLQLSSMDILGFAIVDDGCPSRENRDALLKSVAALSGANTECCGIGHALAFLSGEDAVVETYVILFTAGTYADKSVPQMASAQYTTLQSVAEPFLQDQRVVAKRIAASKKDLYKVTNVTIGRRTEGLKPAELERLAKDTRKTKTVVAQDELPPVKKSKRPKGTREDLYDGRAVEAASNKNRSSVSVEGEEAQYTLVEEGEVDTQGDPLATNESSALVSAVSSARREHDQHSQEEHDFPHDERSLNTSSATSHNDRKDEVERRETDEAQEEADEEEVGTEEEEEGDVHQHHPSHPSPLKQSNSGHMASISLPLSDTTDPLHSFTLSSPPAALAATHE